MNIKNIRPADIERESFAIITRELEEMGKRIPADREAVVKRVIHSTADFSYADSLFFSEGVLEQAEKALRGGTSIVTDTNMALAGINKKALGRLGGRVHCFMADEDVAVMAAERGITRAAVSMEKAAAMGEDFIYAVGNAPTALIRLTELVGQGRISPRLVIGVPVGFVNVAEAKEQLIAAGIPCIVARGRKGGSNVAAAIVNALLYGL